MVPWFGDLGFMYACRLGVGALRRLFLFPVLAHRIYSFQREIYSAKDIPSTALEGQKHPGEGGSPPIHLSKRLGLFRLQVFSIYIEVKRD